MPLASGTQLGHYKIQSLIGMGGMGEVYGAADKAVDLEGCKSPRRQLPVFGRQAYPKHAEVTEYDGLGCKSSGCPVAVMDSGRNDLESERNWRPEHNEMSAAPKYPSAKKSF
jgi:hypothetical protein